ncbi:MAG: hypothetical protein ACFFAU_19500 [Candidatus Hodarchaeota archaeon]
MFIFINLLGIKKHNFLDTICSSLFFVARRIISTGNSNNETGDMKFHLQKYIISVDGTLAEQVGAAIEYYQAQGKTEDLKIKNVDNWHYKINGDDIAEFFEEQFTNNPEFTLSFKPIEGAVNAMKQLAKKFRLIIITSRPKESKETTKKWLEEPDLSFHEYRHIEAVRNLWLGFII